MPANSPKIRMTFWLERQWYLRLRDLTQREDESHAQFIRRAIRALVKKMERGERGVG